MRSQTQVFLGFVGCGFGAAAVGVLSLALRKLAHPPDHKTPGLSYAQLYSARRWRGTVAMGKALLVLGGLLVVVGIVGLLGTV
jgi:hypothetical protein